MFQFNQFFFYAYDAVPDGGLRETESEGNLARGDSVKIEIDDGFLLVGEKVDELVHLIDHIAMAFFGEAVAGVIVERSEQGRFGAMAHM